MGRYLVQRLLTTVPVLLIVSVLIFSLIHVAPGDPASFMAGDEARPEQIARIRQKLGLDEPLYKQLGLYYVDIFRGDLGESVFTKFDVTELILQRLEPTVSIAVFAMILSILISIPSGVLAAWKANSWVDRAVMVFAVFGFAIPVFWLGFNMIWLFAVKLNWFPALGYRPISDGIFPWLRSMTLPATTVGIVVAALIARMTRSAMLEVLREDYIRTARAKGLGEFAVLFRHALRNASIPIVTVVGLSMAGLVSGLVVTEAVFAIPGMGRLIVDGVTRRDYPIIQGTVLVITVFYVLINLLVDIGYGWLDPKIRYQ